MFVTSALGQSHARLLVYKLLKRHGPSLVGPGPKTNSETFEHATHTLGCEAGTTTKCRDDNQPGAAAFEALAALVCVAVGVVAGWSGALGAAAQKHCLFVSGFLRRIKRHRTSLKQQFLKFAQGKNSCS